jgi:hypothetical protein
LTAITRRQVEILRIVFTAKRPNVRAIADELGSPNRLSGDLVELIQKRYLHMEREGKEHFYTITKPGRRCLAKYDAQTAGESLDSLGKNKEVEPDVNEELAFKIFQNAPLVMRVLKMMEERNIRAH